MLLHPLSFSPSPHTAPCALGISCASCSFAGSGSVAIVGDPLPAARSHASLAHSIDWIARWPVGVLFAVWVALWAMRLCRECGRDGVSAKNIHADRYSLKVVWSDARPIPAQMVKGEPDWNNPDEVLVGDAVCSDALVPGLPRVEDRVSSWGEISAPRPASVRVSDYGIPKEPFERLFVHDDPRDLAASVKSRVAGEARFAPRGINPEVRRESAYPIRRSA